MTTYSRSAPVLSLWIAACLAAGSSSSSPVNHDVAATSSLGPAYPVEAAWFKDRWTPEDWHRTLTNFTAQGGDTVLLRARPLVFRTRDALARDVNFRWCGSYKSSTGNSGPRCYDEAIQELKEMGLNVSGFLTYQYEEGYSDAIMRCPKLDRKINSSRIYFRVVLPAADSTYAKSDPCAFANGSNVIVLFTSFSGTDPHQLLLETASAHNVSVYFGLPEMPEYRGADLSAAYYAWVEHVLMEHRSRFSKLVGYRKAHNNRYESNDFEKKYKHFVDDNDKDVIHSVTNDDVSGRMNTSAKSLYDTLAGYNTQADHSVGEWLFILYTVNQLQLLGYKVNLVQKRFAVSATINTNKAQVNTSLKQHVEGFLRLVNTGIIHVVIVQEGRGMGKGANYWPYEKYGEIRKIDPILSDILRYQNKSLSKSVTFDDVFIASNQEVFAAFRNALDQSNPGRWENGVEFWFGLEAFEFQRDDPCLPIDTNGSGIDQLLNRARKRRIDQSIGVAGARVQKIASFAWDSDFTCLTNKHNTSLHVEIMSDLYRPIISNCSFHSPHNLSVVLIGFRMEGMTQGFTVAWKDTRGHARTSNVHGYYFELDYGLAHHLVPSLQYTMLWDIPDMVPALAPDGNVTVTVAGGNSCFFQYSLPILASV